MYIAESAAGQAPLTYISMSQQQPRLMERPCMLPTGEAVSPVEAVSFNSIRSWRTAHDSVPQKPDAAFRFAPYLADACNHSLFHITDPLSVSPIRKSLTQPGFNGLQDYCRRHASASWPVCPLDWTHLKREDVLFAVVTTHKLQHRSQLATRSLQLQGARLRIFSNVDGPLTTALPETALIENRNASHPHKDIQFIAQKHLEMLSILDRFGPAKWYVIADDDTFLFVDRWLSALGTHPADQSLFVGGGHAQGHLCGSIFCNYSHYTAAYGVRPIVFAHAGGPGYALSAPALRRMQVAIRQQLCLDATFGDLATATCARIAGVELARLVGHHEVMDGSQVGSISRQVKRHVEQVEYIYNFSRIVGRITSFHRLGTTPRATGDRRLLCWVMLGECDPRCRCECPCVPDRHHGPCPCDHIKGLPPFDCEAARDGPLPPPRAAPNRMWALRHICDPYHGRRAENTSRSAKKN